MQTFDGSLFISMLQNLSKELIIKMSHKQLINVHNVLISSLEREYNNKKMDLLFNVDEEIRNRKLIDFNQDITNKKINHLRRIK